MQRFLDKLEHHLCDLRNVQSSLPSSGGLELLEEQYRRRLLIGHFRVLCSLRDSEGSPVLDRRNRRILYLYAVGHSQRAIATKVGINQPNVLKRINSMSKKILMYAPVQTLDGLWGLLQSSQSTKTAHAPEVMLGLGFDAAQETYAGSYWGKHNGNKAWKTKSTCEVPAYLSVCFGDKETRCSYCGIGCSRKKVNG